MSNLDAKTIKRAAVAHMQEIAEFLLPNGQRENQQWTSGSIAGEPGQSLKLELFGEKAGLWNDFAAERGGDICDLWQQVRKVDFKTALEEMHQFLKDRSRLDAAPSINNAIKHMNKSKDKNKPRARMKDEATHSWLYRNDAHEMVGKVIRWDSIDGQNKDVKPYFKPDGNGGFLPGLPDELKENRPLYGDWPDENGNIVITEGEKAADAVRQMGFPACTSLGGCNAAQKSDWSRLRGAKQILIWADNDKPGMKYADAVASQVNTVAPKADIRILTYGKESQDAADFVYDQLQEIGWIWDGYEKLPEIKKLADSFKKLVPTVKKWRPSVQNPTEVLNKYLVTEEDVRSIKAQGHKYRKCIPDGQLMILVGVAGSGKTTVMEYICSHIEGEVYYFNMDTPSVHIPEARKRAESGGYHLLCPDLKGGIDQVVDDLKLINREGANLSDVTIVLDTIKKIMDMGDKSDIKRLMKVLRSLTAKGCTVIGLGHTNKYANEDGWPNYEGTVDLRNDCDAMACLIHYRNPKDPDTIITSLYWNEQGWSHAKDRGEVEPVSWVIDRSDNRKVTELPEWIDTKRLNNDLEHLVEARNILHDLVHFMSSAPEGVNQSQIVTAMAEIPHSRRQVRKHLDQYENRLWMRQTAGHHNASLYTLMPAAMELAEQEEPLSSIEMLPTLFKTQPQLPPPPGVEA
jgi:5S rRNA maturation endonuclease (ribonuclease M5)/GTPase SAR1 family protein